MTTAQTEAVATTADDIPFNTHRRDWKKGAIIVAFCIIPVALLVIFTYWPFIQMCGYSFYKMKYIGTPRFVGLRNYHDIFTRPELLATLKLSLYYMVGALIGGSGPVSGHRAGLQGARRRLLQGRHVLPLPD